MCYKSEDSNKHYVCVCGKEFKSKQALVGHYANCLLHKEDLKIKQQKEFEEKEAKRLSNGMFRCENPKCGKEHDGSYGSGRFCSEHCRRVYIGLVSNKTMKRNGTKRCNFNAHKENIGKAPYGTWKCDRCDLIFETRAQLRNHNHQFHQILKGSSWNKGLTKETDERVANNAKAVSKSLKNAFATGKIVPTVWTKEMRSIQSQHAKDHELGGYKPNGGKGKRGRYKGYWCDSSWELAYVIYNIEHGIKFKRNTKGFDYMFKGIKRQYHPDFILDDGTYVEIKGWYDDKTLIKHSTFRSLGYTLKVIDKDSIGIYLDYAIGKYGKDFVNLYEKK